MATVPLSGTNIRLMTGVPFHNDYKNTRWFDTKTDQTNYFLNKTTTYTKSDHTFQRIEGRNVVRAEKSIDELWGTNYMMFQNTQYNSKWFYAFVTKLEYVNKNLTNVHFQLDVFQTWLFEMNFKPSFVLREHCPLWNADGTPVINTLDEGLDYGLEYETVEVEHYQPFDDIMFLVMVTKEVAHGVKDITPTINGSPQPLSYYVHPFRSNGTSPTITIDGQSIAQPAPIKDVLKGIFKHEDTVNNVVSLYVTEFFGKWVYYNGTTMDLDGGVFQKVEIADNTNENIGMIYVKDLPEYESPTQLMGDKYAGFNTVKESKLLMYPYSITYLDDFKGNRQVIKNEYIRDKDLTLRVRGSLGVSNKVAYVVEHYLKDSDLTFDDMYNSNLEHSLINNSPNDISILSDYLSAYLQGNRNTIEQQKNAALWNGTIGALTGGMVGVAQSTFDRSFRGRSYLMANPYGIGAAGLQTVSGVGDAINQIKAVNAKVRDAGNMPASMVKMGGNTAFDYGNGLSGVYVVKKQITEEYRNTLSNYFNMFGYKVSRTKIPNFHTRRYWNYIQTINCNILGNFNNEDLSELKEVFDNGITLWHTDDVGNYALENEVI